MTSKKPNITYKHDVKVNRLRRSRMYNPYKAMHLSLTPQRFAKSLLQVDCLSLYFLTGLQKFLGYAHRVIIPEHQITAFSARDLK